MTCATFPHSTCAGDVRARGRRALFAQRERGAATADGQVTMCDACQAAYDRHAALVDALDSDPQLAADLRRSVGVSSMDSWPATYTATLIDGDQTFRAMEHGDVNEDEGVTAKRAVTRVVAQALAARKAGG